MAQVFTYIPKEAAEYEGGTVTTIPREALGELVTTDEDVLLFTWQPRGHSEGGNWRIPYKRVTYLGYGQHAQARGLPSAWNGLEPKRRHYLTLMFKDDQDKTQTVVFKVGKEAIRVLPKILELRTGVKLQYEDEEARKVGNK
jgi:hypothetical protein